MKKILLSIFLILNILLLSGCSISVFENELPAFQDYHIEEINFDTYAPSLILDKDGISEEDLKEASRANILIRNVNYNNIILFSNKVINSGSGVIFYETDDYYYALTNHHVIEKDDNFDKHTIQVYDYDRNKYSAFIYEGSIRIDLDLIVIVFEKRESELTVLPILEGIPGYGVGVIAIGNPLNKRNVISFGKLRRFDETHVYDKDGDIKTYDFNSIIHTAETASGSSGGMLLNFDLKVIGINYAGNDSESFAIPGDIITEWLTELINGVE